jgi:hypothetical protein
MNSVLQSLETLRDWPSFKQNNKVHAVTTSISKCSLTDVIDGERPHAIYLGDDLKVFWSILSMAEIFVDPKYDQWGLRLFSDKGTLQRTKAARAEYHSFVLDTDFVIGEFLGDADELLIDTSQASENAYPVFIKLPIDKRSLWPKVANSFSEFLDKYISAEGEKYWERNTMI